MNLSIKTTSFEAHRRWTLLSLLIILGAAILSTAQWPAYPYFLDANYHLAVIRGFREAGGPVLHAFWEAAPEGRPLCSSHRRREV